jgi:hypothetical protein
MALLIHQQIGWMKCIACSDSKLRPGYQWIGGNEWILCPSCKGKSVVPRYKVMDPRTGREIDYEAPAARL